MSLKDMGCEYCKAHDALFVLEWENLSKRFSVVCEECLLRIYKPDERLLTKIREAQED